MATEVRLIILAHSRLLMYPQEVGRVTLFASQGCGEESKGFMGELKSLLGHRKVLLHSMVLLVKCAKLLSLIR